MTRFIQFCVNRSTPDLLPPPQYLCFGDWLSINADTPKQVIYTAYFAYSTSLTARAAEVLAKRKTPPNTTALFTRIKQAFNQRLRAARRADYRQYPGRLRAGPGLRPGRWA